MLIVIMAFFAIMFAANTTLAGTAQFTYTEPSTNAAGNPLTNLKETTVYYKQGTGPELNVKVPASAPSGGGAIAKSVTVADPPMCGTITITAQATASNTNTTDFESPRTAVVTGSKSNIVPGCSISNAPTNLTITLP